MATKQQIKIESIARMKKHQLPEYVIEDYTSKDKIYCSEKGKIRELSFEERIMVAGYEKESYCPVYHIIHSFGDFETYELLRTSFYEEDWQYENQNLNKGWLLVHSINKTIPEYSESGSIIVINLNGSLLRIY